LRIGINLLAIKPGVSGGMEFYVRNLLGALAATNADHEYVLFVSDQDGASFNLPDPRFHIVEIRLRPRGRVGRVLIEQTRLPIAAGQYRLDVIHSPSYTWPIVCSVPGVVTVLDMLYKRLPQYVDPAKRAFWGALVPASIRRCRKVLTISEASKRDIVHFLRVDADKVVVTPLALDARVDVKVAAGDVDTTCAKYGVRRPYVLCVGGLGTHKNTAALLRALWRLHQAEETRDLDLVVTGNDYGARSQIENLAAELGLESSVKLPGYVAAADLPAIYRGATAYASMSYFEGFGLTVLEAMSQGVPVVISNCGSLPEVGGDAAAAVDPDDHQGLVQAIRKVIVDSDHRRLMVARGYARVRQFSWERTAQLTLQAYYEAVHGKHRNAA